MDPDRYQSIYDHYLARHTAVQQQLDDIQTQRTDKIYCMNDRISHFGIPDSANSRIIPEYKTA